ncbi:Coiled-coil domain-containing protein 39 [Cichlidogyrus casuarinus]|uniref:Coiled-coil domain-containing protein 39 n=1 Tax=Cichlidogyrus casuarinus TaxID=1844966 RepID=A0ABD2QGW9_9PLAT
MSKGKDSSRLVVHYLYLSVACLFTAEYVQKQVVKATENSPTFANGKTLDKSAKAADERIIALPSAPAGYHTPNPFMAQDKLAKLQAPDHFLQKDEKLDGAVYKNQPIDDEARKLARGGARPSNWTDLHYNLIGNRHLKSEEDTVRALFSWLCSLDPNCAPFPLQQTVKKKQPIDKIEWILNGIVDGSSLYFQAFQALCNFSGIECHVVRGIAKGVAYEVGQKLTSREEREPILDPKTHTITNPKFIPLEHAWNACKIDGNWYLFDPSWAAKRLAFGLPEEDSENKENKTNPIQSPITAASMTVLKQYQTDMFYFMTKPAKLIYTHFPADERWQFLQTPQTLKKFQDCVLLKPSFFRYGLSLYSHREGYLPVKNELTLKFLLPEVNTEKLLFTYNLNLEGLGQIYQGKNLSTYGMHTISLREKMVTFLFRFPRPGYKVYALFDLDEVQLHSQNKEELLQRLPKVIPFPPCNQSSYGPTVKASQFCLQTLPLNLDPVISAKNGLVEIRFCQSNLEIPLPKMAARLKCIQLKDIELNNCILHRQIEASKATTGFSSLWTTQSSQGPCIPMNVVTAYLPKIGEYALEVFAKPSDAEEIDSYHLVWQFLINSDHCWDLSESTQDRLSMIEMGPREPDWSRLGFKTCSHLDPLIRVPTVARTGLDAKHRNRTENEIISNFMATHGSNQLSSLGSGGFPADDSNMGSQVTVIDRSMEQDESITRTLSPVQEAQSEIRPRDYDFQVVLEISDKNRVILLAQMVDISTDEEQDVTDYILKEVEDEDDRLHREELRGAGLSDNSLNSTPADKVIYLVRVPKGGRFYKLFFYANEKEAMDEDVQIPLVYTYLIEAPSRITSSEFPYIGSLAGPFPEKDHKSHNVSLRN